MSNVIVKPVAHKVVDAFWGKGWDQWARFEIKYFNGKMHLQLVKGSSMPKDTYSELYTLLSSKRHADTQTT